MSGKPPNSTRQSVQRLDVAVLENGTEIPIGPLLTTMEQLQEKIVVLEQDIAQLQANQGGQGGAIP